MDQDYERERRKDVKITIGLMIGLFIGIIIYIVILFEFSYKPQKFIFDKFVPNPPPNSFFPLVGQIEKTEDERKELMEIIRINNLL